MPAPYAFTAVTFEIDDVAYTCAVTRAEFTSTPKILRATTLCGVKGAAGNSEYSLELEGVQDWFEAASLTKFLSDNHGSKAEAQITWNASDGDGEMTATQTVTLIETTFGGTADELATFSVTMPSDGKPEYVISQSS